MNSLDIVASCGLVFSPVAFIASAWDTSLCLANLLFGADAECAATMGLPGCALNSEDGEKDWKRVDDIKGEASMIPRLRRQYGF